MNMIMYEYVNSQVREVYNCNPTTLILSMWTPHVVQLKSGISIVVELKFEWIA